MTNLPELIESASAFVCESAMFTSDNAASFFRLFDQINAITLPATVRLTICAILQRNEQFVLAENMNEHACDISLSVTGPTTAFEITKMPLAMPTLTNPWLTHRMIWEQPVGGFANAGQYVFEVFLCKGDEKKLLCKTPLLVKLLSPEEIPPGLLLSAANSGANENAKALETAQPNKRKRSKA